MIITIADLLNSLMIKEKELLDKYGVIEHAPTIGDMYEGLTTEILDKALFDNLNLRVSSGKIRNKNGEYSNEIDCMIVEGEGEKIPYTSKYIYDITQVIAIIEVKKNLYKAELVDSYKKMHRIYSITELDPELINMKAFRDSFRHTVQKELPEYSEVKNLPLHEQYIYHTLLIEESLPLRIVFGYYGYSTEFALREGFYKYLKENQGKKGYSPTIFPSLIICNKYSLAKLHAMPYISPLDTTGYWNFYASTNHNPILVLIEFLWTRLTYKYNLDPHIFGEDVEFETFHPFLKAKIKKDNTQIGWETNYVYISKNDLTHEPYFYEWQPKELNEVEWYVVNWLCLNEKLDLNEPGFQKWLGEKDSNNQDLIDSLQNKRLVAVENNILYLLTDQCEVWAFKGKWYAADNKSGRFTNWINKKIKDNN